MREGLNSFEFHLTERDVQRVRDLCVALTEHHGETWEALDVVRCALARGLYAMDDQYLTPAPPPAAIVAPREVSARTARASSSRPTDDPPFAPSRSVQCDDCEGTGVREWGDERCSCDRCGGDGYVEAKPEAQPQREAYDGPEDADVAF